MTADESALRVAVHAALVEALAPFGPLPPEVVARATWEALQSALSWHAARQGVEVRAGTVEFTDLRKRRP